MDGIDRYWDAAGAAHEAAFRQALGMNAEQIRKDAEEVLELAKQHGDAVIIESGPAKGIAVYPDGRGIVGYIFAHEEALRCG